MAQLKDTIVSGNLRVTDTTLTDTLQVTTIKAPTSSGGSTYGPGESGQVLTSNGSSTYWGDANNHSHNYIPTSAIDITNNTDIGLDSAKNGFGYVNNVTKADWNYQQKDGVLIRQVYSNLWKLELYGDYRTGHLSVRGKNNGTWQNWLRILDTGNTSITTTGSGNAITALSFSNGTFEATRGSTFSLSNHKHTTTIAADSGTNQLTLAASTKYKLTAGETNFIFTTPPNTTYSAGTGLSLNGTTINHSNSVTAQTDSFVFKKIKYDAQGHITGVDNVTGTDLPSHEHPYLPLTGGTLTGRVTTAKFLNYIVKGTGTTGADKGSGQNPRYVPAKWTFNTGQTASDGDIIFIKIPVAGHDYGVYISINNGTSYHPAVISGSSRLTTHYGNGNYAVFVFRADGSASSMIPLAGNTDGARVTVTGGVWQGIDYYDSGNTYDRTSMQTRIYAGGVGVFRYSICAMNNMQSMESFTTTGDANGSPTTTKTFNTSAKFAYPPVIMYNSANAVYSSGSAIGNNVLYEQYPSIDMRYSCNKTSSSGFSKYKPIFIECTFDTNGYFSITSNGFVQTFTSGKYYILVGCMYSTSIYQLALFAQHPLYYYDGTNLRYMPVPHTHEYLPLAGGTMTGTIKGTYSNTHIALAGGGIGDYATLDHKNNINISSWYGVSISNGCSQAGTLDQVTFSVNARTGATQQRGDATIGGNITITSSGSLIQKQDSGSNWTTAIKWWSGGTDPGNYGPCIAQHNTGGDSTYPGSITILPYHTTDQPWYGTVGLFIKKDHVYIDGVELSKSTHTHDYLPTAGGTMEGNISFKSISGDTYPIASNKIIWNGGSDGIDIYYNLRADDAGELIMNMRDDPNVRISFAYMGTVKSYIDANGNFSGNAYTTTKLATARNINGVSFDGSANITIPRSIKHIHTASGTNGTTGWVKIARITVTAAYADHPMTFTIAQRQTMQYRIHLLFGNTASVATTTISQFIITRDNSWTDTNNNPRAYIIKPSEGIFDLYIRKIEGYDHIFVVDFTKADHNEGDNYSVTWTNVHAADSEITGGTEAVKKLYLPTTTNYAASSSVGGPALSATRADYVNVVAGNEIRFYNDNQLKANNQFWIGYSWAAGSHYTPSGGSDTSSTTAPNITKFLMGNCSQGGLASVHAKTFILGNGSSPTHTSKTTTIATAATTTDRTITLPDASGTIAVFPAARTSGQVVVTDGTAGGIKSSGYTIATSVPSGAVFTDAKVTQTAVGSTYTNYRPIVISSANSATEGFSPSTTTDGAFITSSLYCQPSSGMLHANIFKAGKASTTDGEMIFYRSGNSGETTLKATAQSTSGTYLLPARGNGSYTLSCGHEDLSAPTGSLSAANVLIPSYTKFIKIVFKSDSSSTLYSMVEIPYFGNDDYSALVQVGTYGDGQQGSPRIVMKAVIIQITDGTQTGRKNFTVTVSPTTKINGSSISDVARNITIHKIYAVD